MTVKDYMKEYGWLIILLLIVAIIMFRVTVAMSEYKCELKSDMASVVIVHRNKGASLADILKKIPEPAMGTVDLVTRAYNMRTNNPIRAKELIYNSCMAGE